MNAQSSQPAELAAPDRQATRIRKLSGDARQVLLLALILGLPSLYNLSLGTTSDEHLYDRVEDRDEGPREHTWEKKNARA